MFDSSNYRTIRGVYLGNRGVGVDVTEERIAATIELFQLAGLGEASWDAALESLAGLTGSMGAQLIGIGSAKAVPFNITVGIAPESTTEFVTAGGADPLVNSRVRVGVSSPELRVLDESCFSTREDARNHPEYGAWMERYDIACGALVNLLRQDHVTVGMAMMRNARQGNIEREQSRALAEVAKHARAAVRTQIILEQQSIAAMERSFTAMDVAVFLCDRLGRVLGHSAAAEELLRGDDRLFLKNNHLEATTTRDREALDRAKAQFGRGEAISPVPIWGRYGDDPILLELVPIPAAHPLALGVELLVIVKRVKEEHDRLARSARVLFDLTPAEAEVAGYLAGGKSAVEIARLRGVAVGTIRTLVRRLFDKMGVNTQLELAASLTRLR